MTDHEKKTVIVNRGEIALSVKNILQANISSCVSICMYYRKKNAGVMTHISNSRRDDTTPSGKYIKTNGYYYADEAIEEALLLFKEKYRIKSPDELQIVVAGGLNSEGPLAEVLDEIKKYNFTITGMDIMKNLYRSVTFDPLRGIVMINRKSPFAESKPYKIYRFISAEEK